MIKKSILCALTLLLFSCSGQQKQSMQHEVRIISLSPHITEIIYALGLDSNLVAVSDFCKYPPEAQKKESIGGFLNPNIEKIVSLKPTHIFGVPAHSKLNQQISQFGLKILMMPNETLADIKNIITKISDTLNVSRTGKNLIDSINTKLSVLNDKKSVEQNVKAMLVIGREKGSVKNITVAGRGTYLNEIWEMAGGKNIFDDLTNKYATVNIEEIIKRNPQIIIEFNMNSKEGVQKIKRGEEWQYLHRVKAVQENKIYEIGGNYSLIPGPRVVRLANDFRTILNYLL